jgi:hypothetical protein
MSLDDVREFTPADDARRPRLLPRLMPTRCCVCGHGFRIGPSIAMQLGGDGGHVHCPKCTAFLHVQLLEAGDVATERYDDWIERVAPDAVPRGGDE